MIVRRATALLVGALLGAWAVWERAPEDATAPAAEPSTRVAPPRAPPAPHDTELDPPVDPELDLEQARDRVTALEAALLAITGTPVPFDDDVGPEFREWQVRADLALAGAELGFDVERLDCSEYPCVVVARLHEGLARHEVHREIRDRGYQLPLPPTGPVDVWVSALGDPDVPQAEVRVRHRLHEALSRAARR